MVVAGVSVAETWVRRGCRLGACSWRWGPAGALGDVAVVAEPLLGELEEVVLAFEVGDWKISVGQIRG